MTRSVVSLLCAVLFVFAALNTAAADQVAAAPAEAEAAAVIVNDCNGCVAPCYASCCDPCCPPVVYRRGLFGCYRPVYAAPCYYPAYPRYYGWRGGWYGGCCW